MKHTAITFLFAIAAVLFASAGPAQAFNVTPLVVEIDAEPGASYTGQLRVSGAGSDVESIKIYALDWDRNAEGVYTPNPAGALPGTCSAWLSLNPTQINLSQDREELVKYSFTVPEDAVGSYWSFIMVEGVATPEKPDDNGRRQVVIGAKLRYAVRFVVNIKKGAMPEGKISAMNTQAPELSDAEHQAGFYVRVLFENTGNSYLKPIGYVDIRTIDGQSVAKAGIKEFYVFPGKAIWVDVYVDQAPDPGQYLALAVLDYGGEALVAGETRFGIPFDPAPATTPEQGGGQ